MQKTTGRELRDRQHSLFQAQHGTFLEQARALAVAVAQEKGTVSINDIRGQITLPPGAHPSLLGSVFRDKRFFVAGYTQAQHPAAHARIIRYYALKGGV